ncbi:DNA-binding transcriptional regulator, XRE-family HTH domain [Thermanaeromonas toyohensis ToBE]|uniref:DNA-binding transcriptional regulator, XRE-family HTH domain n=1 Tax=Thermanaeromonas toyohensis ToBE TaxID=698762 RepID=A0A1W1VXN9_9FIRM|nr:helix-turn-helix transcriptional regulator [Thermanaeromonas toyohensis]SMB98013.1 DNA-binding transcriptional regulator, XRE-family HTH domain [Thermanaeromonas toyohensis ToBE]
MKRYIDLAKIKALRKQKGLTQEDMAQALGYETAIGYHYLETGKRRITAERLADIAAILGVTVDELYADEPTSVVANPAINQ